MTTSGPPCPPFLALLSKISFPPEYHNMDKFYISRLLESSANQPDLVRNTRLLLVQYVRKPPSFGIVHLLQDNELRSLSADHRGSKSQICLAVLDIVDQDSARYKVVRLVELDSRVVEFDSSQTVTLDAQDGFQCHCVALCLNGDIKAIDLAAGISQRLTGGCHQEPSCSFVDCKLQQDSNNRLHVHLLSQRSYYLYQLVAVNNLKLIYRNSAPRGTDFAGAKLHTVQLQPETILVELEDLNVSILHKAKYIASLEAPSTSNSFYLTLSKLGNPNEAFILRYSCSQLSGYRLKIAELHEDRSLLDPDNLLVREPTFDLEQSWSIDLADIDYLRLISEEAQGQQLGCLCPVYSQNQLSHDDCLPKFLVVTYKHHLLVYSFEQRPSLPFTVSSFQDLNKSPQLKASALSDFTETVDLEQRPKLLHNFKLIGVNTSDTLFNTIFLARDANLIQCRHFQQLGILVGLSSCSDVLAFKFKSDKVAPNKDSIYQQQLTTCMSYGAFLTDQIERTKAYNANLRQDIAKLENKSLNAHRLMESLDSLIQVELKQRKDLGCLYDLVIIITSLIQVSKVVVTSTARSYLLKPSGQSILEYSLDNYSERTTEGAFFLANVDLDTSIEQILELKPASREDESQVIQTSVVIHLDTNSQTRTQLTLNLPVYLIDGQTSQLKVYFVLTNPNLALQVASRTKPSDESSCQDKFYLKTVPIKPLMSYRQVSDKDWTTEDAMKVKVIGSVDAKTFIEWLNECFDAVIPTGVIESSFTRSSLKFKVIDGQVELESQDIIALEIIKKLLLKRATDQSIRLEIEQIKTAGTSTIRNLIEKQCQNMERCSNAIEPIGEHLDFCEKDLLFETLLNEMHSVDPPVGISLESLERSLRNDIEAFSKVNIKSTDSNKQLDSEAKIMQELIFGYIIDLLVDFDMLQGLKGASVDKMLLMRSKLGQIAQQTGVKQKASKILEEWQSIKE